MAANTNTTVTDKATFTTHIIDDTKFQALSVDDKALFMTLRNSMLEIFPLNKQNTYDDICLKFAENFAFIQLVALQSITTKLQTEISNLKTQLDQYIVSSNSTVTPGAV